MVGEYPLLRTKGALRAAGAAAVGGLGNAWAAALVPFSSMFHI
jgi:hypothetical protein